ncbi:MAG: FlgD immunoglobulin-like domain containing protein [bacterium]
MLFLVYLTSIFSWAGNDSVVPVSEWICDTTRSQKIPAVISTGRDTALGDVIFEMDVETPTGDNQLLGVEFDGTYFYVTGGAGGADPNKVYVIDTTGNVVLALDQPDIPDYWGWRDLAWDGVYTGADRIDTLYGSCGQVVHKFGISFADSTLQHYGSFLGPCYPLNRALAYMEDSAWFFTSNGQDSNYNYKFSKTNMRIDSCFNNLYMYGAAYDTDLLEGGSVWWHSQEATPTPFYCLVAEMDALSMNFTGVVFYFSPTIITSGIAGGLCFYEGFRGMDVLFALVQGNPSDIIVGIFVRYHAPGVAEESSMKAINTRGMTSCFPNPTRGRTAISYTTIAAAQVSLQIYDKTGCLVKTLVNNESKMGNETVHWDGEDSQGRRLPNGVYFVRFETQGYGETDNIILIR